MKNIKDIHISTLPHISPKGRPYRISSITKGSEEKWINGILKNNWFYMFKYLDDNTFFTLYVSPSGEITKKKDNE